MIEEAMRLAEYGKAKAEGAGWYRVEQYDVQAKGSKISCACLHDALHGAKNQRICKHILAAIWLQAKETMWKFGYGKVMKNGKG